MLPATFFLSSSRTWVFHVSIEFKNWTSCFFRHHRVHPIMLPFSCFPTWKGRCRNLAVNVIWIVIEAVMTEKIQRMSPMYVLFFLRWLVDESNYSASSKLLSCIAYDMFFCYLYIWMHQLKKVAHAGCVNRIRSMIQKPHICATWGETGHVQVIQFLVTLPFRVVWWLAHSRPSHLTQQNVYLTHYISFWKGTECPHATLFMTAFY